MSNSMSKSYRWFKSGCIIRRVLGCIQLQFWRWLTIAMESGNVVLDNILDSGVKVKGSNEVLCVIHMWRCFLHEMSPIIFSDLSTSDTH